MNSEIIVEQYRNTVKECLQGVQSELDVTSEYHHQLSFSRIDALLDQLPISTYPSVLQNIVNHSPKFNQISFPFIEKFSDQLIQEIKPIIIFTIQQEYQLNQQKLSLQYNHYQSNSKPFTYDLIHNNTIQQSEYCYAIAFNQDNSIILAGHNSKIKVFEFKQEQLKLIQLLSEHQDNVTTLNFMKKQTQFISGSDDCQILIWSMNSNNQWICSQRLNEHQHWITCLIQNNNEDLIISGSFDQTIKFWIKQNQWACSQTITDHKNDVLGLCLNEKQNRVISCGTDNLILIIEESLQKWNVIQKITVQQCGYRLCFINDNVFTFQPLCKDQMHVYEMNSSNNQYSKTQEVQIKCDYGACYQYFPQQYIKSKCVIVNKNGKCVNLIRKNQNGDFLTQQSIQFGNNLIYGQMSENGEYLITWDAQSNQIQIRKFHQL